MLQEKYELYIGNSLSMCVEDILDGRMRIEKVVCIIAASRFPTMEDAIKYYSPTYWRKYNEGEILATLIVVWPRVLQPRIWDASISPNTSGQKRWILANCGNSFY